MHRGQTHLGSIADQGQNKCGVQPGAGAIGNEIGSHAQQVFKKQAGVRAGTKSRIGQEKGTQQGQGNPHGADEQILPGRFQGASGMVIVDVRGHGQRGRFHRHPHQPKMMREDHQRDHGQREQLASAKDPIGPFLPTHQVDRCERLHRKKSVLMKIRNTLPSGSRTNQFPRPGAGGTARAQRTRSKCPRDAPGKSHGRHRFDGTANARPANTRGSRINK